MSRLTTAQAERADSIDRWIEAARADDGGREAIGEAIEACRRYLMLVAVRELGDDLRAKVGASDLVQETFLDAQRDFGHFRGRSEAELRAWLRRILRNNLATHAERYRQTAKRRLDREISLDDSAFGGHKAELEAGMDSPSEIVFRHERAMSVRHALERLPESYRRIIEWRHREGGSFEEIGRRLGGSADAARKLWARAILRLQKELGMPHAG